MRIIYLAPPHSDYHLHFFLTSPYPESYQRLLTRWQELAEKFNEVEDQELVIAKVDCSIEKALCAGM